MRRLRNASAVLEAIYEVREMPLAAESRPWTICLRTPSGDVVGHFRLPSYEHVSALDRRLRALGYRMSILHPEVTGCDVVFAELSQEA